MKPILIIVPSKGRPNKIDDFFKTWRETTEGFSDVLTVLDDDDPTLSKYSNYYDIKKDIDKGGTFAQACNRAFRKYPNYKYYFVVSDDHRIRTKGWEKLFMKKIEKNGGKGVAYGNDLLQGEKLATSAFISGNIFRALGFVTPPTLIHMFTDKFWTDLGSELGKLFYFPDVIVEHIHFSVGKSKNDKWYKRVNNQKIYNHDLKMYEEWKKKEMKKDLKKIKLYKGA